MINNLNIFKPQGKPIAASQGPFLVVYHCWASFVAERLFIICRSFAMLAMHVQAAGCRLHAGCRLLPLRSCGPQAPCGCSLQTAGVRAARTLITANQITTQWNLSRSEALLAGYCWARHVDDHASHQFGKSKRPDRAKSDVQCKS